MKERERDRRRDMLLRSCYRERGGGERERDLLLRNCSLKEREREGERERRRDLLLRNCSRDGERERQADRQTDRQRDREKRRRDLLLRNCSPGYPSVTDDVRLFCRDAQHKHTAPGKAIRKATLWNCFTALLINWCGAHLFAECKCMQAASSVTWLRPDR